MGAYTDIGMGPGGGSVVGTVNAAAVAADGTLYVRGSFSTAGSVVANNVARWDGAARSALGTGAANGVNSSVRSLAVVPDGTLYVGGDMTTAGGAAALRVARWTGAAWATLGSGITSGTPVAALAVDRRGDVVLGGLFTAAGGIVSPYLTLYDEAVLAWIAGPAPRAYRMLAAPAAGLTLGDVLGPLWTQGFPGADSPNRRGRQEES